MTRTLIAAFATILAGALLVGSCSRAHEPDDGASGSDGSGVDSSIDGSPEDSAPTDSDSPPPDAEEVDCPSTCLSTCGSGTLECHCSVADDTLRGLRHALPDRHQASRVHRDRWHLDLLTDGELEALRAIRLKLDGAEPAQLVPDVVDVQGGPVGRG